MQPRHLTAGFLTTAYWKAQVGERHCNVITWCHCLFIKIFKRNIVDSGQNVLGQTIIKFQLVSAPLLPPVLAQKFHRPTLWIPYRSGWSNHCKFKGTHFFLHCSIIFFVVFFLLSYFDPLIFLTRRRQSIYFIGHFKAVACISFWIKGSFKAKSLCKICGFP